MTKSKKIFVTVLVVVLFFGILIPKLTVHDLVTVEAPLKQCVDSAVNYKYGSPFGRIALFLGKSRITKVTSISSADVESFTLFRIPMEALPWEPKVRMNVTCDFIAQLENIPVPTRTPQVLSDGIIVQGLGQFHDASINNSVKAYASDKLGVSFNYPVGYLLFESKGEGAGGREYYVITVAPEIPIRRMIASTLAGEGPPSIHLSFFSAQTIRASSLSQWIRANSLSNFDSSETAQVALVSTTVAGIPALKYFVRGLYDTQYIAFRYGEWIVVAASDFGEGISPDFQTILSSFQFKNLAQPDSLDGKILACGGIPNESTQKVVDTSRLFINLPRDVYPDKENNLQFKTISGNATSGYISNGGLPGLAFEATPSCWSYYNEFDGKGEVDLRVKSSMKDMPDYFVRFIVHSNP